MSGIMNIATGESLDFKVIPPAASYWPVVVRRFLIQSADTTQGSAWILEALPGCSVLSANRLVRVVGNGGQSP